MLRVIKRVVLALLALVVVAVLGVVLFVHTDTGRNVIRKQAENQLDKVFTGGATIGAITGSPLGELVLHDVVIDGPDRQPAITAKTLKVRLKLTELVHEHVVLDEVVAEDVDVRMKRDADGALELGKLLIPRDPDAPKMTWKIDLPKVALHRAHLMIDTGTADLGTVNLDGVELAASGSLPVNGSRSAAVQLTGTWRERGVPVSLATAVADDRETVSAPLFALHVGLVGVTGSDLRVGRRADHFPRLSGNLQVIASRAAVAALVPRILLPADVALGLVLSPGPADLDVALAGAFGPTAVSANVTADLAAKHLIGTISTGDVDLATLTDRRIVAIAGATGDFDIAPGGAGELPTAKLHLAGHATYEDLPRSDFTLALATQGQRATTSLDFAGAAKGKLVAEVARAGDAWELVHATLVGSTPDPRHASGGRMPLQGSLDVSLAAHGVLTPKPSLAVSGSVKGKQLRLQDVSIGALDVALDASQLPARPTGTAHVVVDHLQKGDVHLDHVDAIATASTRADATIVGEVHTTDRRVAVSGTYARTGDLAVRAAFERLSLGDLRKGYVGMIAAHVEASRTAGRWAGTLDVDGKGLALQADGLLVELAVKAAARPGSVTANVTAINPEIGRVDLALDVAAPQRLEDVAAWRTRGRESIKKADVKLSRVDLTKVVALVAPNERGVSGRLDGAFALGPTTLTGRFDLRELKSPRLRGIRQLDASLELQQPAADELVPTVVVAFADIGKLTAQAHLAIPARMFDPSAWRALGDKVVRSATIHTDTIAIDPALLDRLKITSTIRARAGFDVVVGEAMRSIDVHAVAEDIHGAPIAKPVALDVHAKIDGEAASATMAMTQQGKAPTLVTFTGKVPMSLAELRAAPATLRTRPLAGVLELPQTSAVELLGVFGRTEITSGTIDGKITLGGTVGNPRAVAHVVGTNLAVPPGPRGKPVKLVQKIAVDATGDRRGGKFTIDGTEERGGKLHVTGDLDLDSLAAGSARIQATAFDLQPLFAFAPGPAGGAKGRLDADLQVQGFDLDTAKIVGEVHLHDARVPLAPQVGTLRKAEIDIVIHPHDIAVTATGKLGKGNVKLNGTIALDGVSLSGGRAKLTLRKVSPIGAIEPVIDADVDIKLARVAEKWTADIVVDNGLVKITSTKGEAIKPTSNPADLTIGHVELAAKPGVPGAPPVEPSMTANVTLHRVRVESEEFHSTIGGKLAIILDSSSIGITGQIAADHADLDLFDRRYGVELAEVTFDGSIDPQLAIRFTHDFSAVTTITTVRGRLSKPELELSSNPGTYSQSELLGFLLGGEPGGDATAGGARDKLTGAGTSLIAGKISGYVRKALPFDIDVIRYEVASVSSSAAITVGTWLTHTLFFAYRQHLGARPDENSGEGTVEYWLTKRLEIEGTAGDRGYDAIDLLWRRRF